MDYMEEAWETSKKIAAYYADEKYTDKAGVVWLGIEGDTRDEDHWLRQDATETMSSDAMMKKMMNELMGWDQTPVEDPYEYNIERTSGVTGNTSMCYGDSGWDNDLEVVREDFKMYGEGEKATSLGATYRIVKRRKAGAVQDV